MLTLQIVDGFALAEVKMRAWTALMRNIHSNSRLLNSLRPPNIELKSAYLISTPEEKTGTI